MTTEFDLIRRHFTRPMPTGVLGPGDDCALLPAPETQGLSWAVTTDTLAAGTHFFADVDPEDLGWKSLAVSLSDLAAMGATPRYAQAALCLPHADESWITAFAQGLYTCADAFDVSLTGGDLTKGSLNICVTAIGTVDATQTLKRSNARPGDDIWISGLPGQAALGLAHLQAKLTLPATALPDCLAALHRPQPRIELGKALLGVAHAAVDISDGLLADLRHLLKASDLAAEIQLAKLPALPYHQSLSLEANTAIVRQQLNGGDDYELCFCAPVGQRDQITAASGRLSLLLSRIGKTLRAEDTGTHGTRKVIPGEVRLLDAKGQAQPEYSLRGYEHFA